MKRASGEGSRTTTSASARPSPPLFATHPTPQGFASLPLFRMAHAPIL